MEEEAAPRPLNNVVWLVVLIPLVLCCAALLVAGVVGTTYYSSQIHSADATSTQAYGQILQARATQTKAALIAEQELTAQAAEAGAQQTAESLSLTATSEFAAEQAQLTETFQAQANLTATATITPTATRRPGGGGGGGGGGSTGNATVIFKECRGYEGSVTLGGSAAQPLHAFESTTFTDVPPGTYFLKVVWSGHGELNFNNQIQIRTGTQVIPFGDQCR